MNFLLNAIDGAGDGGFGDDDDGGWGSDHDIDLSDDEEEYDTETTGYDTEATPQQPQEAQPPPPASNSGAMNLGGGMFMGRLTQFLDTVAPQQQGEDEGFSEGDGWADDDVDVDEGGWDDDNIDLDQDPTEEVSAYVPNENSTIYTHHAVVAPAMVFSPAPRPPPPRPPPPAPPAADPSVSFGGESMASSAAIGMASTDGMTNDLDASNNNDAGDNDGAGWDDDDGLLFDDEDNNDVVNVGDVIAEENVAATTPLKAKPTPVPPPPPPPPPPAAVPMDDNNDNDGWDDDDGLMFDDDNVEDMEESKTIEPPKSFVTAPPPPPPPPPPPVDPIDNSANDDGDGWGDDDGLMLDDDNLEDVTGGDAVESEMTSEKAAKPNPPPPPPPPPAAPVDSQPNNEESGWDDDDDLAFDDDDEGDTPESDGAVQADSTPQQPPIPSAGFANVDPSVSFGGESTSTSAAVGNITTDFDTGNEILNEEGDGWDDEDGLLDDVADEDLETEKKSDTSKLVDSTPLPPPPPVDSAVSSDDDNGLDNENGWGDDDDLGMNLSDDFQEDITTHASNSYVVDHIPPPTPPRKPEGPSTDGATDGDDDISKDDTLSIDNSRSQQNAVSGAFRSSSTIGDEDSERATDLSATDVEVDTDSSDPVVRSVPTFPGGSPRFASRKVVDKTPRQTRFSGDASLLVAGHTSVGESLDSIDEVNEEDFENELDLDNAEQIKKLSGLIVPLAGASEDEAAVTPRTMESGWGALRQNSQATPSQTSSEIPFGSALTPTAANNNNAVGSRYVGLNDENTNADQSADTVEFPLVDHTPGIPASSAEPFAHKTSMANSVDVLGDSSEGDLGEADTVGVDDIKDELYGPMVDVIPPTPREDDSPTRRKRKFSLDQFSLGSVLGQAEDKDVQKDIREDDAMDDEEEEGEDANDEAKGLGNSMPEFDNRSLLSGLPLPVVDETEHLVDHVPTEKLLRSVGGAASTMVQMDASTASSRAEDNVVDDDGSNHVNFGPIVDHTPSLAGPSRGAPSIATSVATAVSGLEGDIKQDDDMDDNTTVEGGGGEAGAASSLVPREDENLNKAVDDHIVDHIPEGKARPANPDASVRVLVGKEDDMTQVDTIAEDVALEFGPIVDHTPVPFSRISSGGLSVGASLRAQRTATDDNNTATIGSISQADDNSGWDHDEPDLDDLSAENGTPILVPLAGENKQENNLVDHIPRRSFTKPVDGSTIVLVDPVDAASEVDDADDDTAGNARVDKFGPVVDHTPAPQSAPVSLATSMVNHAHGAGNYNRPDVDVDGSATWFGASTLGGMSSAAGDDDSGTGWDDDDLGDLASPVVPRPVQAALNDHLVDHVPSLASPRVVDTNASTAVAVDPSVLSTQTQDDKMGGGLFGAVVDHTPSVDPNPRRSTDNSTNVTGFASNNKPDEEMDETTWQGGVSAQGEGWDQDDPELEDIADADEDISPHLVDHVPERPESRYGDPSLVVAANPSDLSSQVEDLNQDENHFGPVVDQTPLERVLPPPAVGSTVVALPSVLSDEGDNDGSNAEGARVPNEWEEQMPNPQSGIDSDNTREQLVDAVPPPPLPEQQPMVRDASSEMAFVDDKSTSVPADEPKEDEFGPVVDHTPMADSTDGIEAHNGDAHRLERDGDKKPAANLDSVAPIYSVESKEKQDGLDEDEFGPVVDQLPAASSKSSLAPSKGGSTVDALATVSQGEDDLNTRDGWDDDTLDIIDQASPANMSHRASHSVTWDENVFHGKNETDHKSADTSKHSNSMNDTTFFTASEINSTSQVGVNETRFYDAEDATEMNGWGNDSLNIADDDTPPSTPRGSAVFQYKPVNEYSTVETTDYPDVKTLLETNGNKDAMVGVLKTPEGDSVEVNFQKLLQDEMTKRLLLEKESEALRKMVDSLKEAKEMLLTAAKQQTGREDELMGAISKWQEANGTLSDDVSKFRDENGKLSQDVTKFRDENGKLSQDVSKFRNENGKLSQDISKFRDENGKLSQDISKFRDENGKLSQDISKFRDENGKLAEEISAFKSKNDELFFENERLSSRSHKLSEDVMKIEKDCTDLRGKNDILSNELESLRMSISQLEEEKSHILSREAALSAEVDNLKSSLEKQLQQSTSDASLRDDIRSAQMELSAKVNECSQLNSQLILVQEKLRKSEAQNFKHTKDLAKMTKDHAKKISELQTQLNAHQKDLEDARFTNAESIADLERRLSSESKSNQNLQTEKESLIQQNNHVQLQFQKAVQESQHELSQKDVAIQSRDKQLKSVQENNINLTNQVNDYAQQLERFSSLSTDFESISRERDHMREALNKSETYVASLKKQCDDVNITFGLNASDPESVFKALKKDRTKQSQEITALKKERINQMKSAESSKNQLSDLTERIHIIESEKNTLQSKFEEYRKSQSNVQNASAAAALNAIKEEAKLKKIQVEVQQLRRKLQDTTRELQNSGSERTRISGRCTELETEIARLGHLTAHTDKLQEELLQFKQANESQEHRIQVLENSLSENERTLSSKDQEIAHLRQQQQSSHQGMAGAQHEKTELLSKLQQSKARIIELESECEALARDNEENQAVLNEKNAVIDGLNGQIGGLNGQINDYNEQIDDYNGQIDDLNEELQVLSSEREALLNEKNALTEENEEMLVQFGWLSEQMVEKEAEIVGAEEELVRLKEEQQFHEEKLNEIKNEAQAYQEQLEEERRQHEQTKEENGQLGNDLQLARRKSVVSEEKLNALIRESEEMTKSVGNVDENTKKLIEVNAALRDKIRAMASEQSAAEDQIQAMESHKLGLNGKVEDLQNLVDELIASFEAKEGKLQSQINIIKGEKQEIANKSLNQETEIAQLSQELEFSKGSAEEYTELRRNLTDMENRLSEQDRLLLQKDAAAQDLYNQLQHAGNTPMESAEMEMLRQTVQDLEATVANDKKQLQEMGEICDQTQRDLLRTTEQLQFSEETAQQLDNDLQSKQNVESTNQMLESRLDQLENELMAARTEESKLRNEASGLKQQLLDQQSSKELSSEVSNELENLRRQVKTYEEEKNASCSAASVREVAMEDQLRAMRDQMAKKDDQISGMEDKLRSLDINLHQSHQQMEEKQETVDKLTAEVEKLNSVLSSQSASSKMLALTPKNKSQAEDLNRMQMQVIALAQALEKSENCRAEVLEKIETERQQHSDTLRRMKVNMQRFYAALNMSEL